MVTMSSKANTTPDGPTVIPLGPLFPRLLAVVAAVPLVIACWFMPLAFTSDPTNGLLAFLLGCAFLALLFLPRLGMIEVDAKERRITFHESTAAGLLHIWRWRELRRLSLPPHCKVVVGEWLDENAFPTSGVKRVSPEGQSDVLIEQKFVLDSSIALRIVTPLRSIGEVEVETVRLNEEFQQIAWKPKAADRNRAFGIVFVLPWVGFVAGLLAHDAVIVTSIGVFCFLLYLVLGYQVIRAGASSSSGKSSSRVHFALGAFQFVLMYTVLALIGSRMK